ncbi:hypothetical protein [Geodermatophilus sp. URMC 64]
MTVQRAVAQLSAAVEELWTAVGELVLIVCEDQPEREGLAVADQLVESVSEIQGVVADARTRLAAQGTTPEVTALPEIAAALHEASVRYWRDVRGHEPVAQLRAAARTRGGGWPAWRRSVEQSAARCVDPFDSVAVAVDAGWQEICQLAAAIPGPRQTPSAPDPYRRLP